MEKLVDYIKESVAGMFAEWPIKVSVEASQEDDFVMVDLKTSNDALFVQPKADPLLALQHLIRLMVRQKFPETSVHLTVNIGDFHQRQRDALTKVAEDAIKQAKQNGAPVYLSPMSSFERRIVHMVAAADNEVVSESSGVGPGRRVIIKPAA
ncbi:MAG: R3H domain-containing nucleic acid-binding protein [Patescibacteria group bacterium]|jgi:spoIIIJ-associated protein